MTSPSDRRFPYVRFDEHIYSLTTIGEAITRLLNRFRYRFRRPKEDDPMTYIFNLDPPPLDMLSSTVTGTLHSGPYPKVDYTNAQVFDASDLQWTSFTPDDEIGDSWDESVEAKR
jgi:hypothetical protein